MLQVKIPDWSSGAFRNRRNLQDRVGLAVLRTVDSDRPRETHICVWVPGNIEDVNRSLLMSVLRRIGPLFLKTFPP